MKKLIVLVLVSLLVGMVSYGADYWYSPNPTCIRPISGYTHVGIGTNNPAAALHVNGTALMTGFRLTTGAHNGYVLTSNSSGVGTWKPASGGGSCYWSKSGSRVYYNSGNVGIGTANPVSRLHVSGGHLAVDGQYGMSFGNWGTNSPDATPDAQLVLSGAFNTGYNMGTKLLIEGIDNESNHKAISVVDENSNELFYLQSTPRNYGQTYFKGNVGIGTTDPDEKLEIEGGDAQIYRTDADARLVINTDTSQYHPKLYLRNVNSSNPKYGIVTGARGILIRGDDNDGEKGLFVQNNSGNVGIGTINPGSYKLAVNGHIRTKEITVESDWSDFVFADNYQLMPLEKLEKHIRKEKSLPGIPTEKEVKEKGVEVGEMQAKLLEKVEELTLYVIELKKENKELRNRITALEN